MHPRISLILYSAFFLRISLAFINVFLVKLPDAKDDAYHFESSAWEVSLNGIEYAISQYPGFFDSWSYAWLISVFYALTDRSILAIHSVSVVFSILSLLLVWKISIELWDYQSARIAVWIFALCPTLAMYGSIPLRESFYIFFLLWGFWFLVKSQPHNSQLSILQSFIAFLLAVFFHVSALVVLVILFVFILFTSSFNQNNNFNIFRGSNYGWILIPSIAMLIFYLTYIDVVIPKFGPIRSVFDLNVWQNITHSKYVISTAAYPKFIIATNVLDFVMLFPIRIIYFLFSPFPWDISKISHLFGLFDAFFYLFLMLRLFSLRRLLYNNPEKKFLLLALVGLIIIFSIFTTNFGTGLRHRSKLLPLLLILVSPKPKNIFSLKK